MKSNFEFLQKAVDSIRRLCATKGQDITVEDIAQKAGLSPEKIHGYLRGEVKIPEGLDSELLSFYGIKRQMLEFKDIIYIDSPTDDEYEIEE